MKSLTIPLALTLTLASCLENEEEIVIHEDGSCEVTVSAKGDLGDLSNGYAVPLGAGWEVASEDTATWLRLVGADTGSAAVQAGVDGVEWPNAKAAEEGEVRLSVRRRFASVDDLPQWFATEEEPYRSAFSRRSALLHRRSTNGRTVYVFERTYHGRRRGMRDAITRAAEDLPEEIQERFEGQETISAEDWDTVAEHVRDAFATAADQFARDAILGLYTKGDASLAAAAIEPILTEVRHAAAKGITLEKLVAIHESELLDPEKAEDDLDHALRELEEALHQSIRDSLNHALQSRDVPRETRHAILFSLEWGFTAYAHSDDVRDENFTVTVEMPGTVISGNYGEIDGNRVGWFFDGDELDDRDQVMRVVSVVE